MYQSSLVKNSASGWLSALFEAKPARGGLEREVEDRLHLVVGGVVRGEALRPGVAAVERDLAEHEEVRVAVGLRDRLHARPELLPELVVDVLHRVDPEAVDVEVLDPGLVDVDHPVDHLGTLGEEVVEAEEVAVLAVLAGERGVAPVVVHRQVVEPGRRLEVLLRRVEHGVVGERRRRVERRGRCSLPAKSRSSNGLPAASR